MHTKVKLFNRCSEFVVPEKQGIVFQSDFIKMGKHSKVSLCLTKDDVMYLVSAKGRVRVCRLSSDTRFMVKEEAANQQGSKEMRGVEFQSMVFKFSLERDDYESFELYSFSRDSMRWFDVLHGKIHLQDYQMFYELDKLVGKGSFASVYVAKHKQTGQTYAAKAFFKKMLFASDAKGRQQIDNEISIMRRLSHPNLINLHDVFENKAQVYLIIDLARGGTLDYALRQLNGPVPFLSAKVIFHQIVEGVAHMHEKGIMHRDLKPSNILFKSFIPLKKYGLDHIDANVMISDFGISSEIKERLNVYQYCGSPGFMAPEVFQSENDSTKSYDQKCDIFSLGCILYQLLTGKMLFQGNTPDQQKKLNMDCHLNLIEIEKEFNGSHSLTVLLSRMLAKDPKLRPSCKEILDSKILYVEYTEDGVPVFKDFQRPKSSPPKRQFAHFFQESNSASNKKSITSKAIKIMPMLEEKKEQHEQDNPQQRLSQKRQTHAPHQSSQHQPSNPHPVPQRRASEVNSKSTRNLHQQQQQQQQKKP